jgi:hypothetical protein
VGEVRQGVAQVESIVEPLFRGWTPGWARCARG